MDFQTSPERYRHWRFETEGQIARLTLEVDPGGGLRPGYELKLNSYDLGVDLELADALQRVRFEHPEVRCLVVQGGLDRVFCAGANIQMLRTSEHRWKVNFCKFTNETRVGLEELGRHSGVATLAACNGTTAGGGYELALACDRILLVDDGHSAVSLPEVSLLGVLPGTGGLTRLVDKRGVRRDRADVFCTLGEGIRGRKALEWRLVDELVPRSRFQEVVEERAREMAGAMPPARAERGIRLEPLEIRREGDRIRYRHVEIALDRAAHTARLDLQLPAEAGPDTPEAALEAGSSWWWLRAFRELDDALLQLRINEPGINLVLVRVLGDPAVALAAESLLGRAEGDEPGAWFLREARAQALRTLKRMDLTAKSFFALAEGGTAFAGAFLELGLAADRLYVLDDPEEPVELGLGLLNRGALPMSHGLSRLEARFYGEPGSLERLWAAAGEGGGRIPAARAEELGLATAALDAIDWEEEIRVASEERASFSPDALTGMEANLRFPGPETLESRIFGRLTAWQNWIFQRPNATGPEGALQCYGEPRRPRFDMNRT